LNNPFSTATTAPIRTTIVGSVIKARAIAAVPAPPRVPKNRAQARFRDSFTSYRTTLPTPLGAQPILANPAM
jgi:hypothetical protein